MILLALMLVAFCTADAGAAGRTWFVRAAAGSGGADGSIQRPFGSLADVQQASLPGDTIVILSSPAATPPLDGGIALKAGQRLVGDGPSVTGIGASAPAPRIANTSGGRNSGDAVVLADGAEVSNVAIVGAYRGGIYGSDVSNVAVRGNDVTATNTSCTTGFVVQPFVLPTSVPGVGVPFSSGLPNGWAGIMVDESHTTTTISISGNVVHDAGCADGIDVRASGTADATALVDHNTLTHLRQDISKSSLLAIGMQTTDTAHLLADVRGNTETYIGTATAGDFGQADSEGVFENTAGHSHLIEHVDHNVFAHGLGHISANCVEMAASNGGPTEEMTLTNSTCDYVVGDIIEAANLSRDATLSLTVDHVRASHSTFVGSDAWHPAEPGDDGDCLLEVASGAASTTSVTVKNSQFTNCVADGIGVVSNVVDGVGGAIKSLRFDVQNSQISANHLSNLRVASVTDIQALAGRVENSDLSQSDGTPLIFENRYGPISRGATSLDLGGGALGSAGHNCIYGGGQGDAMTRNYDVFARQNWWGAPSGPAPGRTVAIGGAIVYDPVLGSRPGCGPTAALGPAPGAGAAGAAPRACTSRRVVRVRVERRYRRRMLSATVLVGHRRVGRLRRGQFARRIDLRGRRAGPITLEIVIHLRGGRVVASTRHLSLCAHRRRRA